MVKKRESENICSDVVLLYDDMFPLYLVKGKRNFLMDSGISARAEKFRRSVDNALGDAGKLDGILLTHSHYDHAGAASYLQDTYECDIHGSERTVELLKKPKVIDFINHLNEEFKKVLGVESSIGCKELKNLEGWKEGDRIEVDESRYFTVYSTPGHTKCSVSYLLEPEGVLFPGDSVGVIERNGTIKPLFLSSYKEYENSIRKLIGLEAEILAFCHNRFIKGKDRVKAFLEKSLESSISLKDKMLDELKKGITIEEAAENILDKVFPQPTVMGPREALMINVCAMLSSVQREFGED